MWLMRAGGQRPGAVGERTGAVHRRCRSGDAWPQPGDPAAAWGRWVGVAPAGMERGGGCGPSIPKPDQVGWNGSMECSTPPRACLASFRSWLACILSQKPSLRPKKRHSDRVDAALRYADRQRQPVLTDPHRSEELLQQHLARMHQQQVSGNQRFRPPLARLPSRQSRAGTGMPPLLTGGSSWRP